MWTVSCVPTAARVRRAKKRRPPMSTFLLVMGTIFRWPRLRHAPDTPRPSQPLGDQQFQGLGQVCHFADRETLRDGPRSVGTRGHHRVGEPKPLRLVDALVDPWNGTDLAGQAN